MLNIGISVLLFQLWYFAALVETLRSVVLLTWFIHRMQGPWLNNYNTAIDVYFCQLSNAVVFISSCLMIVNCSIHGVFMWIRSGSDFIFIFLLACENLSRLFTSPVYIKSCTQLACQLSRSPCKNLARSCFHKLSLAKSRSCFHSQVLCEFFDSNVYIPVYMW